MNLTSGFSASLSGPDWLKNIRARAAENIERMPLPTTAEELWRYSRVDEIDLENLEVARTVSDLPGQVFAIRDQIGETAAFIFTANGALTSWGSTVEAVKVRSASEFDRDQELESDLDPFVRLNTAFNPGPVFIDIDDQAVITKPIFIAHWIDGEDMAVFPRTVIRARAASEATVVEYFISADRRSFVSSVTEVIAASASNVQYLCVQDLTDGVRHVALQRSSIERDAAFGSATFSLGGDYARTRTDSKLMGPGASSKLRAVYVGRRNQMHDFRTLQDHRAPKTSSDLLFKGVVGDTARSVYSGLIRVEKGASGTNAFQTNRNLVISEGAHADSVPNLEIEENDVRCSHASAVGPVDEDQLYYLESRGVPTDVAERLIISGFLRQIIEEISLPTLKNIVAELVKTKLDQLAESNVDK